MHILVLVALLRLHVATGNTLLCAGIYAAFRLAFAIFWDASLVTSLLVTAISFVVAYGYFALLDRLEGATWWVAAIGLPLAAAVLLTFL